MPADAASQQVGCVVEFDADSTLIGTQALSITIDGNAQDEPMTTTPGDARPDGVIVGDGAFEQRAQRVSSNTTK